MERETGLEPATSSLGSQASVESKSLARICCELLNLQHLAESAFFESAPPNEAPTRQALHLGPTNLDRLCHPIIGPRHAASSVGIVAIQGRPYPNAFPTHLAQSRSCLRSSMASPAKARAVT